MNWERRGIKSDGGFCEVVSCCGNGKRFCVWLERLGVKVLSCGGSCFVVVGVCFCWVGWCWVGLGCELVGSVGRVVL